MFIERSQKWPFRERKNAWFSKFSGALPQTPLGGLQRPPAGLKPCYARLSRFARPFIFVFSIWRPLLTEILDPPVLRVRCVRRGRRRATSGQRRPLLRCWGLAPCSMSLTLSARASGGHRFVRLDPPSSCFISIFACQGDHDSSAQSCMHAHESRTCSLSNSYATKVRSTRINNNDDNYN